MSLAGMVSKRNDIGYTELLGEFQSEGRTSVRQPDVNLPPSLSFPVDQVKS